MNKIILIGRLVRDPESKTTQAGKLVVSFSLAVNRRFQKDEADFINIIAWEKTGEFVEKYFRKGQQVAVVGRLQIRSWKDNEGKNRYATEVIAEEVYFADSKKESGQSETRERPQKETTYSNDFFSDDDSDNNDVPF